MTVAVRAAAVALLWLSPAAAAERVTVFAAASLTDVFDAAIGAWRAEGGGEAVGVYAASSTLARQIGAGAPAALFVSANAAWVRWLDGEGLVVPGSRADLFGNRLVVAAPPGSTVALPPEGVGGLAGALAGGRLAMADPAHVPAGMYAKEALESLGVWPAVRARVVPTGHVRAALALIERGEVALGIVYRTDLAVCRACREVAAVPADSHSPIVYRMVAIAANRSPAAAAFRAFLLGDRAAALFAAFGFAAAG